MPRRVTFSVFLGLLTLCAASAACEGPLPPSSISVTEVSPTAGTSLGSTPVTISGIGFKPGATVEFGGVAAAAIVVSSTTISATAPAHADGAVHVVVTNPDGHSGTRFAAYTYQIEPAFAIFGVVTEMTDEGEIPVEGAEISESGTRTSARTDASGAYRLSGLRRSSMTLSMNASGYVPSTKSVSTSSDMQLNFRVARIQTFVLSGMVYEVTPDGRQPLEGVVLYCDGCGSPVGHTFVTTDADGLYRFAWTLEGPNWIQFISKDGYRYAGRLEPRGIPLNVIGNTRFDIELVKR